MKCCDFYVEPKASLMQASPLVLAEIGARTCYDSYSSINIDKSVDLDEIIQNLSPNTVCHDAVKEALEILKKDVNMIGVEPFTVEHKKNKTVAIKTLLEYNYPLLLNILKPNIDFIREVSILKKHESVLEHCFLTFQLEFPRNVLQEISRHRIGVSPSVRSTRYTLTQIQKMLSSGTEKDIIEDYIKNNLGVKVGQDIIASGMVDVLQSLELESLTNDFIKNFLPENWWTHGQYSMSLRAFKHMMDLRLHKSAFMPFRRLAHNMYSVIPEDYKQMFKEDYVINLNSIDYDWFNREV